MSPELTQTHCYCAYMACCAGLGDSWAWGSAGFGSALDWYCRWACCHLVRYNITHLPEASSNLNQFQAVKSSAGSGKLDKVSVQKTLESIWTCKISAGCVKKYSGQSRNCTLFTSSEKFARVGWGQVRAHLYPTALQLVNFQLNYSMQTTICFQLINLYNLWIIVLPSN